MKLTIRTKLIAITAFLLLIPSLLIGLSGYVTAKKNLDQLGSAGLKNNVKLALDAMEALNDEVQKGTLSIQEAQEKMKEKLIGPLQSDGTRTIENEVDMGEYGYFFVLDKEGMAVAHPTLEGKNLFDSQAPDGMYTTRETIKAAENGGGFVTFDFPLPGKDQIAPKIVYAEKDPAWGWIVVSGTYLMDFNRGANDLLVTLAIVLGTAIILGLFLIIWFSGHLSKPIRQVTEHVAKIAEGDLSAEKLRTKNKDEIGQLTDHVNQMSSNLKQMIEQVSSASMQVAATSEQLSASSEQTSRSVEQVAGSIQELAYGADTQMNKAEASNEAIARISDDLKQISLSMEKADQSSKVTAKTAENGADVIAKTISHMHTIQNETASTAELINQLGKKSTEITTILSMITEVAAQTQLLALNAAIEAARAGEHGRGFAVVADEVKKLAEQSEKSANQVGMLIQAIQKDIDQSVHAINKGHVSVNEGLQLVNGAGEAFQRITTGVHDVLVQIGEVSTALQANVNEFGAMAELIEETTKIAIESASHTQNIAAAAEEQTASMQEIAAASDTLAKMAEELQESVKAFKL
ncbi:methyl-accepting chemotaxis protein [Brevibacillus panacihumi]|nr:methyl-accepting chemotaxis protein [Brevibacillus panacihumi]